MSFKEQLLKELREDKGFIYGLQRELEIDDLEFKIDEINNHYLSNK